MSWSLLNDISQDFDRSGKAPGACVLPDMGLGQAYFGFPPRKPD